MSLFITGTDTNVGKTFAAALIIRTLRGRGVDGVGFKPICCGGREDAEQLHAASDARIALGDVNPVWLRAQAAPYAAAMIENRAIDLALIRETFTRLRSEHESIIVEGAGGWLVPITRDFFMSDLAAEFALPVAIVVANRLGALNHALLTVRAVCASGCSCVGIILNSSGAAPDVATATNRALCEELLGVPMLAELTYGQRELTARFPGCP